MDSSLAHMVQQAMFDYDLKFSDLARRALVHYIRHVLPLSQHKSMNTRGNLPVSDSHNGPYQAGNLPANGALTIEQVAQLFNLMQKAQK